jgi:hypothetical protein
MAATNLSQAKGAIAESASVHKSHDNKKHADKATRDTKLTSKELLSRLYDSSENDQALQAANRAGNRMLQRPKAVINLHNSDVKL